MSRSRNTLSRIFKCKSVPEGRRHPQQPCHLVPLIARFLPPEIFLLENVEGMLKYRVSSIIRSLSTELLMP
jgi:hypothetical protein